MAEPTDYFLQGANLGMRAVQAGAEMHKFRTNLAERARQFDLNREIALDELDLKTKEFTMRQESHQLDQSIRRADLERTKLVNDDMRTKADNITQYAPVIQDYTKQLERWNGVGEPPFIPDNLPPAQRDEAIALRNHSIETASNNKTLQLQFNARRKLQEIYLGQLSWMAEYSPEDLTEDQQGNLTFDPKVYAVRRRQFENSQKQAKMMTPQEWLMNNAIKFYKAPDEMNPYGSFDSEGLSAAFGAATGKMPTTQQKPNSEIGLEDLIGSNGPQMMPTRNGQVGF